VHVSPLPRRNLMSKMKTLSPPYSRRSIPISL
jgi:hypothetical protein